MHRMRVLNLDIYGLLRTIYNIIDTHNCILMEAQN